MTPYHTILAWQIGLDVSNDVPEAGVGVEDTNKILDLKGLSGSPFQPFGNEVVLVSPLDCHLLPLTNRFIF